MFSVLFSITKHWTEFTGKALLRNLDMRDLVSGAGSMLVSVTEFRGGVDDESKRMLELLEEDDLGENPIHFAGHVATMR